MSEPEAREVALEVDAPGVHPPNVHAVYLLEAAAAYFAMLETIAAADKKDLRLSGVEIRDKCAELVSFASDAGLALLCSSRAAQLLSSADGVEKVRGTQAFIERIRDAARRLGPGYRLWTRAGDTKFGIEVKDDPARGPVSEWTTIRVFLVRAGGAEPCARFTSEHCGPFTLDIQDEETARLMALHLYRPLEIEALVSRSPSGRIEGGEVKGFRPVPAATEEQELGEWRAWFKNSNAGRYWSQVDDIEEELRRDD